MCDAAEQRCLQAGQELPAIHYTSKCLRMCSLTKKCVETHQCGQLKHIIVDMMLLHTLLCQCASSQRVCMLVSICQQAVGTVDYNAGSDKFTMFGYTLPVSAASMMHSYTDLLPTLRIAA